MPAKHVTVPLETPRPRALHEHAPRPHVVRNANHVHKEHQAQAHGVKALNQKIAVFLTMYVGQMWTAYGFAALAIVGLFGVLAILQPSVYTLVAWVSQTFIQLVLLPVIMVGQSVLSHHAELQAEEQFKAVINTEHDAEQLAIHLTKQDDELLQQTSELLKQTPMIQQVLMDLAKIRASLPLAPSIEPVFTIENPVPAPAPRKRTVTAAAAKQKASVPNG